MPLYLQRSFAANYRMVTLIPTVFGVGKWTASLPTGYLLDRLGRRPLMLSGLLLIALIDVGSVVTPDFRVFLGLRAVGGVGWAMFGTVATAIMVDARGAEGRGRAISALMMSETSGLLLGSMAGGWLFQVAGMTSPFVFEAGCMLAAIVVLARSAARDQERGSRTSPGAPDRRRLAAVLHTPGVLLMGLVNATLIAIQTGALVFLFPLYLSERGHVRPGAVGVLVSLTVLGRLAALWLGGRLSDRWGRTRVLVPGLVVYAALLASLTFLTDPGGLALGSVAIGGAAGFVMALPTALVGDRVPPDLHGVAIGWLRTMTDTGQILGPLVLGALADAVQLTTPFLVASLALLALAWRCHRP